MQKLITDIGTIELPANHYDDTLKVTTTMSLRYGQILVVVPTQHVHVLFPSYNSTRSHGALCSQAAPMASSTSMK